MLDALNEGSPMHASSSLAQPVGLYVLCAVEVAAGFALYVLGSLLLLHLIATQGLDEATALRWVGGYNAATFLAPLVGGALADAGLRLQRAVRLGAILLSFGFVALALRRDARLGLSILVLGNGLFRSNVVALLGRLYPVGDPRLDAAYRVFYAAFNFGGLVAPPIAGLLAQTGQGHAAFLLAAAAMGLAALILRLADPYLVLTDACPHDFRTGTTERPIGDVRSRWLAIGVVAQVTLLWALSYGQTDGVLLLWVRDYTVRGVLGHEISPSAFVAVPPLFVLIWAALAALLGKRCQPSTRNGKLAAGLLSTSLGFALLIFATTLSGQRHSAAWPLACLSLLTLGELLVVPVTQSLMGQLAPRRHTGLSYALWYAAAALGLYLAGQLGAQWYTLSPATFFALVAAAPLGAIALIACGRGSSCEMQRSDTAD